MARAKKCDKCGSLYEVGDGVDVIFSYPAVEGEERPKPLKYELCFSCANDTACFLELNEKVEENA